MFNINAIMKYLVYKWELFIKKGKTKCTIGVGRNNWLSETLSGTL